MAGSRSALAKVSLRNIGAHKLRLALTVLAVVLGTAFISGSMMFTNMLERTFDSAVNTAYEGSDVVVEPAEGKGAIPAEEADAIRNTAGVARANAADTTVVVAARDDEEAIQTRQGMALVGVHYGPDQAVGEGFSLIDGHVPNPHATPAEAVLNANGAQHYGVAVGEEIIVVDNNGRNTVRVVGLYEDGRTQGTSLRFLIPEADYLDLYVTEGYVPTLKLAADESVDAEALRDTIAQAHPDLEAVSYTHLTLPTKA